MIVFSHIPKTAGTTLNNILRSNYGSSILASRPRKEDTYTLNDFKKDKKVFSEIKVLSGHGIKSFIDFKEYEKDMQWITFLRDPQNTLISLYIHQQTSLKKHHQKFKMPFDIWMTKFPRNNRIVKWIAGSEDLSAAKEIILKKYKFIGFVEKFDESLLLMASQLNLKSFDMHYQKQMVGRDNLLKNEIKNNLYKYQDQINENILLDNQLYTFVKEMVYPKYIEQFGGKESLDKALEDFNQKKFTGWNNLNLLKYKVQNNLVYKPYWLITR
jgi:hypothetical protein